MKRDINTSGCLLRASCLIFSKQRPYKSRQLSGYGHGCNAWHLAVIDKIPVTFSKPLSGPVGDVYSPLWLTFSSLSEDLASGNVGMAIMPGGFYQQTPDAFIARFGYWAFVLFLAGRRFGTGKTQIAHKLAGSGETSEGEYLGDYGNRRKRIYSVEATQKSDHFFISIAFCELFNFLIKRSQTLHTMLHFRQIAVKDIPQQRLLKLEAPQPVKVLLGPVIAVCIDVGVAGKELQQLVTYPF